VVDQLTIPLQRFMATVERLSPTMEPENRQLASCILAGFWGAKSLSLRRSFTRYSTPENKKKPIILLVRRLHCYGEAAWLDNDFSHPRTMSEPVSMFHLIIRLFFKARIEVMSSYPQWWLIVTRIRTLALTVMSSTFYTDFPTILYLHRV